MRALLTIARSPPPTLEQPTKWSENFKDFLAQCLKKNPIERLSCNNLLKHPFLQETAGPTEAIKLIKRKDELRDDAEEDYDDDGEPVEFDESMPGADEEDEEDVRWLKKATQMPGVDDDLELLDDSDMDAWLQAATLKKKQTQKQQQLLQAQQSQQPQEPQKSQPQEPQQSPSQSQPQEPQQSQPSEPKQEEQPKQPQKEASQTQLQIPPTQPQNTPETQSLPLEQKSPRQLQEEKGDNTNTPTNTPRKETTKSPRSLLGGFFSQSETKGSPQIDRFKQQISEINLRARMRGKTKSTGQLLPERSEGSAGVVGDAAQNARTTGTVRKLKRQGSVVQLQKERRKVDDHKLFLQLAKALGKLVEQHKQQQQRLIKQQQKELETYMQSMRDTTKRPTMDHMWLEKEAEQLSKQQIQITRKLQERHKAESLNLRSQSQSQFQISRKHLDKLGSLYDMELKAMQDEHALQMKHMIESSNLEIDQAEQRHAQQAVHQTRMMKQQLDRIVQLSVVDQDRVKQKYAKMQSHLEKLFQLERDQQIEMQKAELAEQSKQALLELKQWQKDKLQEHKKAKDQIKLQKTSKEAKAKELANFKQQFEEEAQRFREEWQKKKEEDSELLKELHIFQQETLKEQQENRKTELQQKLAAEIKNTNQKPAHMKVQQCIAKIDLLENQAEQIQKLKYVCLENQREVFYRSQAEELQLLSKHSAEQKIPSPRLTSVTQEHTKQHHLFITMMAPGSEALARPPHYDSQIAELKTELETLKKELFQFPASSYSSHMTLSDSGQYMPPAHTSVTPRVTPVLTSTPAPAGPLKARASTSATCSNTGSSPGLNISGIGDSTAKPEKKGSRLTGSTTGIPPPPPIKAPAIPSDNVRSDILSAIESFSSRNLKKTVTKDKGATGFKVQGLLTSITGYTKSKLKQTVTVDKSKPLTNDDS